VSRSLPRHVDGVTILTVYVVLLMGLPSNFVVGPIGAAGSPAQLVGIGMLLWWIARRLARPFPTSPVPHPVRKAALFFTMAVLASYVAATIRPIEAIELRAADRGLLALASWLGVVLVAADEISDRDRLALLLRRLVLAGGLVAALGVVQFQTGTPFVNYLLLPGLTQNSDLGSVIARSGFARPAGTAIHPIEFGVMISMALPLALHFALSERDLGSFRRWFPVAAIGIAIPLSISRSAMICTAVAIGLMIPAMSRRARAGVLVIGGILLMFTYVTVPGMLGTIIGLFTGISGDDSAKSRTDSYSLAWQFISHQPIFGRGFYTFLPEYRILDNQYLATLIEMGVVGLIAVLALFCTGIRVAVLNRKRSWDVQDRLLSQALLASIAAGGVSFAFFDALAFPMVAGLVFLLLGVIGSQHRLNTSQHSAGRILSLGRSSRSGDAPAPKELIDSRLSPSN
jgi:polysaccharide biosynthesis protein PslJ